MRVMKRKSWIPQPIYETLFLPDKKSMAILGTKLELYKRSIKESWLKRKYIGVWRRESIQIRIIIITLPPRAARKTRKMRVKRTLGAWRWWNSPRRTVSSNVPIDPSFHSLLNSIPWVELTNIPRPTLYPFWYPAHFTMYQLHFIP